MNAKAKRTIFAVAATVAAAAAIALGGGCASTEMTSTWTSPAANGARLTKVAVVCMASDEGVRRTAEDQVARYINREYVVPSYQVLGGIDLNDRAAAKARLKQAGLQGVLVMRVAGVSEQVVAAGGPYDTFDAYYDYAADSAYAPDYLATATTVRIVSNLYSLTGDGLMWSGASSTFDPTSVKQMAGDVARAVAKELEKRHIIA